MTFPWVGVGSALLAAAGGYGMLWYHGLSKAEREQADCLAAQYARQLYSTTVERLTSQQRGRVHDLVKGHFA
jgi:hypothetical protein